MRPRGQTGDWHNPLELLAAGEKRRNRYLKVSYPTKVHQPFTLALVLHLLLLLKLSMGRP